MMNLIFFNQGISVMVALSKLYESVLNKHFTLWFKPDQEQAGAVEGRGCAEHLITLRLLIDLAQKSKQQLYIAFVDYEKAYDLVKRSKLLDLMLEKGCGSNFLKAIYNSLKVTQNIINSAVFSSTSSVRQGSTLSCALFTLYINNTIRPINSYGPGATDTKQR
jgi:hypothetical protein